MASTERYEYEPFPSDGNSWIRIARLKPQGNITLRIEEFSTHRRPEYEALSYVWGVPSSQNTQVWVSHEGDHSRAGMLDVGENLSCALEHLALPDRPRDLWIDAICIDQRDEVAKGPQVAMMDQVFRYAGRVIVFLGRAADGSDRAMEILGMLGSSIDLDWLARTYKLSATASDASLADPDVPLDCGEADMVSLYRLFCREWFDRLWIRQEITLAKQDTAIVQCGSSIVPWSHWHAAWYLVYGKGLPNFPHAKDFPGRLLQIQGFLYQDSITGLDYLRDDFTSAECGDPRDRIYAVKGMLDPVVGNAITPDYTLSVADVYRDAVLVYMRSMLNLDILEECQYHTGWTGPSWVPDWSVPNRTGWHLRFPISPIRLKVPWELLSPDILRVSGVKIATLTELAPAAPAEASTLDAVRVLLQNERRPLDGPYPAMPHENLLDAYIRTLCADSFHENHRHARNAHFPTWHTVRAYLTKLLHGDELSAKDSDYYHPLWFMIRQLTTGRRLVHTTSGAIGLALDNAQPGDMICSILGCCVTLLLLRPLDTAGQRYQVIGPCYLCGFSSGEAILGPLPQGIRPVWIEVFPGKFGPVFEDVTTGIQTRMDPRLEGLGVELTEYRKQLETESLPGLEIDEEALGLRLEARGLRLHPFELV